jgi:hypothetical protein
MESHMSSADERDDFIAYPTNRVVGTITDAAAARRAVAALTAAGFARDTIDVLHGEQDLERLDPSGTAHGVFAQLQRAMIRGAAGSEIKHLNYHVDDVRAGKSVIMVLAPEGKARDVAANILHAHGAEFVGFYGRWAYESLSPVAAAPETHKAETYDLTVDGATERVTLQEGVATMADSSSSPGVRTTIGPGLYLLSWPRVGDTAIVHVIDVDAGVAYGSISQGNGAPRHVKGTIAPVR